MQTQKLIEHLKSIQERISGTDAATIQSAVTEVAALMTAREGLTNQFVFDIKKIPVSSTHPFISEPQVSSMIHAYISFLNSGSSNEDSQTILLHEIEELIRTVPERNTLSDDTDENFIWLGRVSAVIQKWKSSKSVPLSKFIAQLRSVYGTDSIDGFSGIMTLLHEARADIRIMTVGPVNVAIDQGAFFDYFDEIRKIMESASNYVFVIDPHLGAEFVSRYLSHVKNGVQIRLLTFNYLSALIPAVEAFSKQHGANISVRSIQTIHDRYVIIDRKRCFQSGASFKDGAKNQRQLPKLLMLSRR